jgi:hypothetical protein
MVNGRIPRETVRVAEGNGVPATMPASRPIADEFTNNVNYPERQ